MTPLHNFQQIAQALNKKPSHFWLSSDRENLQQEVNVAICKLKKDIEAKNLTDSNSYKILAFLEKDIINLEKDEAVFIQHLGNLLELYRLAPADKKLSKLLDEIDSEVTEAKKKILEYHIFLESLLKKGGELSEEEKNKKDLETLQKVGIFYVLEYTLQVLYEFTRLSDEDKTKLLKDGLQTEAGNLPAFLPLEDSFRKDLCYKIFDDQLRDKLMETFYKFEEVLYSYENLEQLSLALKELNLNLLMIFNLKGLVEFKANIYAPFGNNLPMEEMVRQIESFGL